MSEKNSSKVLITDETNLGSSYFLEEFLYNYVTDYVTDYLIDYYHDNYDDDDDDYYYDDYDDDDDYYYYDNNYYGDYYYPTYPTRYWYDDDYYDDDDDDDDDDYYYDDYHDDDDELSVHGDTLKVGDDYDENIWLNDVTSGSYATIRVIDAKDNDKNLFITGNSRSNSIYSGDGVTTLWGAGGDNTLIGGSKRNYFFYQGGSKDVAAKFTVGETSKSDVVVFANGTNYSSINRDDSSITFNMSDGNYIRLQPGQILSDDNPILISRNGSDIYRYKIAKNTTTTLSYRDNTNEFYFSQPGQILVSGNGHNIWLGGENGQQFTNVSTLNASASEGYNTLAGNDQSNVIIGGKGISSLWGGVGGASDTLIGGQGSETFFVGRFEGSDSIYTEEGHDLIFLYDTNLSDFTAVNIDGGAITAEFNTGNSLKIYNNAAVTPVFQLAGGERYNYNRGTGQWQGA